MEIDSFLPLPYVRIINTYKLKTGNSKNRHMSLYSQLEIPMAGRRISISMEEAEFIYGFLKSRKIKKTLETGLAYGCSAAHIIAATGGRHYAMDPYQKRYSDRGLKNIKRLGLDRFLSFKNSHAHTVLPELLKKGEKIEFAFIDGSHLFDDILIDFYFIDLMLVKGGYVLFHDSRLETTQHAVSWIRNNKKNYVFVDIPMKDMVLIRKTGNPRRKSYHFEEFCPHTWSLRELCGLLLRTTWRKMLPVASRNS